MPKKYPPEFKRDVVTVARRGDLSVAEVAVDFGVAEESVRRWMNEFVNLIWPRVDGLKWPHLLSLSGLAVLR